MIGFGGETILKTTAIIADDLTGASDAGVQFAGKGLKTQVMFELKPLPITDKIDTVVIDTDSRGIPAQEAYQRVKEAAAHLKEAGFAHFYKKVDSTLRGNLGTEIDAMMDVIPFDFAVVAPAFPKIGRTTLNGYHYLKRVPVDQTEIGRDPKTPVTDSDLIKLLSLQSKRKAGLIKLETIRRGKETLLRQVNNLRENGVELVVFDAETEEDLERIAGLAGCGKSVLWVGSAGLADFLPEKLDLPVRKPDPLEMEATNKPVFLVAGSISTVTREQVAEYCRRSRVTQVELNPLRVVAGEEDCQEEIERCRNELLQGIEKGYDLALYTGSSRELVAVSIQLGRKNGLDSSAVSNRVADCLGRIASEVVRSHADGLKGVILTGGDTAKAVCRHLGVSGMQLLKELEPGVPISRLAGAGGLFAVTKAGAFGTKETLVHALLALKGVD
jgi:uncharacterized protein YgbK (DUF1537 family)